MILSLLSMADLDAYTRMTNTSTICNAISFLSYPADKQFLADWIAKNEGEEQRVYGIYVRGQLAGSMGAHCDGQQIEVGYWVNDAYAGRGITSRALTLLLEMLTQRYDMPIFAECVPSNTGSKRVLEKAGFTQTNQQGKREGRMRFSLHFKP